MSISGTNLTNMGNYVPMSAVPEAPLGTTEAVIAQIRAERAAAGMTQAELASAAGMAQRSLARYLSGERKMTLEAVEMLARALGLDLPTLLRRAVERQGNV